MKYRTDRLRCLGNAVVPAQAEYAFRCLAHHREDEREDGEHDHQRA